VARQIRRLERRVAALVRRARRGDEELAHEQQRHQPRGHPAQIDRRQERRRDEHFVGDRVHEPAEHGAAVLARQVAVDEISTAEQRREDERHVLPGGAVIQEPAGNRNEREADERDLVRGDERLCGGARHCRVPLVPLARTLAYSRPARYSTMVATPKPVPPLATWPASLSAAAGPAMSTCTHGVSPTNSFKNSPAVSAPP